MQATDTTITTAEQLDNLPIHTRVADGKGVEWKKFYGPGFKTTYWAFRRVGGYNHDSKATSERLAQYGPLTVIENPTV